MILDKKPANQLRHSPPFFGAVGKSFLFFGKCDCYPAKCSSYMLQYDCCPVKLRSFVIKRYSCPVLLNVTGDIFILN
ncbi:MAG: hypothetical protein KAR38_09500 [Calditrichia bacterium]|nr:hypothetical protein [Calditrichia bacterium]